MTIEKILIVDDEPYVLEVCRRVLEEKYHVKIVHSGVEAIQLAQDERFDLLLTDIKMPGLDGLETAKEVRKNNPDIVCVTMTGYSSMETAIKALRLGIDEFIIKPFNPEELILAVERALEKERLRKENIRLKSLLPLFEFNKSLMSTVETKRLLQQILDLARQEIGASDIILYMIEESGVISHLTLSEIPSKRLEVLLKYRDELVKAIQCKNAQLAIEDEEDTIIFLRGGWQDIALEVEELDDEHALLEDLLSVLKVKSMVATPLLGVGGKLQGVLLLTKRNQIFTQSECNFLSVMTGQATIAYENARLFENLQQAYDELKTLDYMKSEFTNRAAHELRTPLAIIVGYASILEEDIEDKTQKGYLKIILRNSLRLRSLVEDLLNMRYIASGQLPLTLGTVDLNQIIDQIVQDMTILAREKNVTLSSKIVAPLPVIYSDKQKLELIIMNLVTNAIKFTPSAGQIWIDGWVNNSNIEVEVADNGIGIPETEHDRIFDSFYQIEDSLNRKYEGIGLGLAISKGMIERCGGKIWVKSEVGQGSRFIFSVPIKLSLNE